MQNLAHGAVTSTSPFTLSKETRADRQTQIQRVLQMLHGGEKKQTGPPDAVQRPTS